MTTVSLSYGLSIPVTIDTAQPFAPPLYAYFANRQTYAVTVRNQGQPVSFANGGVTSNPVFWWARCPDSKDVVTAKITNLDTNNGTFNATFSPSQLCELGNPKVPFVFGVTIWADGMPTSIKIGNFRIYNDPSVSGTNFANNYLIQRDIDGLASIDFVNNLISPLASTNFVNNIISGYISTNSLPSLTNGFVKSDIINGLASTDFVVNVISPLASTNFVNDAVASLANTNLLQGFIKTNDSRVINALTNGGLYISTNSLPGLASTNFVNNIISGFIPTNALPSLTNGFVKSDVTNGWATTGYVQNALGVCISTNSLPGLTNGFVKADITNGLASIDSLSSTVQSYQFGAMAKISSVDNTNTIIITDAGSSNPGAWGTYTRDYNPDDAPFTNALGWSISWDGSSGGDSLLEVMTYPSIYLCSPVRLPMDSNMSGMGNASGTVHIAYAQMSITNWISTNDTVYLPNYSPTGHLHNASEVTNLSNVISAQIFSKFFLGSTNAFIFSDQTNLFFRNANNVTNNLTNN